MDSIIAYFTHIPSSHRAAIIIGGLAFFFLIENITPFFSFKSKKGKHLAINLFFTATTVIVNVLFATLILAISDYCVANKVGLLQWADMPAWAMFLVGLLAFDLVGAYLPHMLEHRITVLWRFHVVHHTDPTVDTTTANRHHPLESVIRALFTTLGVAILGAPIWVVMAYQSASVLLSQFNHANIRIPKKIDDIISYIIVSPDMHKVHHHYRLPYTDSNYGNIFSIWDRLFKTFTYMDNPKEIVYGLDTYPSKHEHSNLSFLLKQPFLKYRKPKVEDHMKIEQDV